MKRSSIQVKIIAGVILPLFLIILILLGIIVNFQRKNLHTASEKTLRSTTSIINTTIRNLMLDGKAPLVIKTIREMQNNPDIEELEIYRRDGTRAFHDYQTLEIVNKNLKKEVFKKTERLPNKTINNQYFRDALSTRSAKEVEDRKNYKVEYYFPVLNFPECRKCHGSDHFVRGILTVDVSTKENYKNIRMATLLTITIFTSSAIIIGIILFLVLRKIILRPLLDIGTTVREVGKGKFDISVGINSNDEIGELGDEINRMIKGLEERFHLSRYVSRTTEDIIRERKYDESTVRKESIVILFSDIRNFTSFAESNPPDVVIGTLRKILSVQAEIVEQFGGDIDKFIGDAIMATFKDRYTAIKCGYYMIKSVTELDKKLNTGLKVGVGINYGDVIFGHLGTEKRLEYAVIGDTVNVASRLSDLAKPNMILVSESVIYGLQSRIKHKIIPNKTIKGKKGKINFYVIQSIYNDKNGKWMN